MKNENNTLKYILMVTLLFGIALVCMVPLRVDADGNVALQKDYFRTTSGIQVDSEELANYRFDVLESNVVPLSSGTGDYTESALHVVLVCFIFALVALYVFWFLGHKKRIEFLIGNFKLGENDLNMNMECVSILHPIKMMRYENDLENQVVVGSTKSV